MPVNKEQVVNEITIEILNTVNGLQNVSLKAKQQMYSFLGATQPEINEAVLAGDLLSLSFIQDRISTKLASITLDASQAQRDAVRASVDSILQILVRIGIASLIAV